MKLRHLIAKPLPSHAEASPPPPSLYARVYKKFQAPALPLYRFIPFACSLMNQPQEDLALEMLRACGLWFDIVDKNVELGTKFVDLKDCEFCFVDIESTGSRPQEAQIIEIAAIKLKNAQVIQKFESLVYAKQIPQEIQKLTGLRPQTLCSAPSEREVLAQFREFLGRSVFVAHNVNFDYNFISARLEEYGGFGLLNPRICSVELAQKTILSARYSLAHLNRFLGINIPESHRAYCDTYVCMQIFKIACLMLPARVQSLQDLIEFSRGKKL